MNINTGDSTVDRKLSILVDSIKDGNKDITLLIMEDLLDEAATNKIITDWMVVPSNITELHNLLIENLNVNPRGLKVRTRNQPRHMRGIGFIRAMLNGLHKL